MKKGLKTNIKVRNMILKHYENFYKNFENIWISWLTYEENEIMRCLKNNVWENCDEKSIEMVQKYRKNIQSNLETNPYGFYAQYNPKNGDFCIRDVSSKIPTKKHKRTSGKRCINWGRQKLIDLTVNKLKIPIGDDDYEKDTSSKELWEKIQKNRYLKKIFMNENELDKENMRRVLYWGNIKVKQLCSKIKEWFDENNLLVEDLGCGKISKQKI